MMAHLDLGGGVMKPSRFNVFIPLPNSDDYLLFNTFTDARAHINEPLKIFLESRIDEEMVTILEQPIIEQLLEMGFLCRDEEDEDRLLDEWFQQIILDPSQLSLTILTTYACNLRCSYCYQQEIDSHAHMDLYLCADIVDWLKRQLDQICPSSVKLTFYGGEPLLNIAALSFLTQKVFEETQSRGIILEINIITNGVLLSPELIDYLKPYGLKSIKVTLDGDPSAHNSKRPFPDGRGSFTQIWENIGKIKGKVGLIIGGNYDSHNKKSIPRLLDKLLAEGFRGHIEELAFKPTLGPNRAIHCFADCPSEDFLWLVDEIEQRGFRASQRIYLGPCEAQKAYSFTIDPYGELYKCPAFVGMPRYAVGNIKQTLLTDMYYRFMIREPQWWHRCQGCPYVPLCCGGCCYSAYLKGGDIGDIVCEKHYLEKVALKLVVRDFLQGGNRT